MEELFSQIGPIKKSSVIVPHVKGGEKEGDDQAAGTAASSYGFIKYVSEDDAQKAAEKLDRSVLRISADEKIQLRVERASDVANNKHKKGNKDQSHVDNSSNHEEGISHKKTNRLIIRNLSFYAKESHIRQALQSFGPIEDIHLPTVSDKTDSKTKTFHRGFGFVTFVNAKDAQKCLQAKEIEIYKRKVQVAKALHKAGYEKIKHNDEDDNKKSKKNKQPSKKIEEEVEDNIDDASEDSESSASDNENEGGEGDEDDNNEDTDSASESESEDENEDVMDDENDSDQDSDAEDEDMKDVNAVREKRSLFLRNLPFDASRHDVFEAFRKYGRISGIFIVKDKQSGLPRGTAFLSYETPGGAQRALKAAGSDSFASQRDVTEGKDSAVDGAAASNMEDGGIVLRGRRIFVNIAVDKDTATTLTLDKQADKGKMTGKDRRNLYLKGEGRVDNEGENNLWDQLPEQDKLKRQKAWSEKNTKLKSPLFLISPTRLSIRNLAKDIDERSLKKLCVSAVQRGIKKKLVTAEDQIAQWRAAGEMTTREIIEKMDDLEHKDDIIPEFDDKNIRKFMPSVVIERDFSSNKKDGAPSRGFGFVEFLHHTHALACLRELNNSTTYTEEYVSGGRQAVAQKGRRHKKKRKSGDETETKLPRLIVEFAVENRAKAKKQAEHKAQQRANTIKQKLEHKEKLGVSEKKKEKKKSRGARQRERKRKQKEEGIADETKENDTSSPAKRAKLSKESSQSESVSQKQSQPKAAKPTKKRKIDKAEEKFSKLVDSYQESLVPAKAATDDLPKQRKRPEKRWFEN